MPQTDPLNSGLFRVHRVFYIAIFAFVIIMLFIAVPELIRGGDSAGMAMMGMFFLPIGVVHWFAARGVRSGKTYGKILSRILGSLWLVGVPIGTALGIYVWSQTGTNWMSGEEQTSAPDA